MCRIRKPPSTGRFPILLAGALPVQDLVVTGMVLGVNTGQPLIGAQISLKGRQTGTLAGGGGGRFFLEGVQGQALTLRVEMKGGA